MDALPESLRPRALTSDEVAAIADDWGFDLAWAFVAIRSHEEDIVVTVETGTAGDDIGYDPDANRWVTVGVSDVSDDPIVHLRAIVTLFDWLAEHYPDREFDFDPENPPCPESFRRLDEYRRRRR